MSGEVLMVLAYALVWGILTGYLVLVTRRMSRLEREIRELKAECRSTDAPHPAMPTGEPKP